MQKSKQQEEAGGGIRSAGKELHTEQEVQSCRQGRVPQQALYCPGNRVPDESTSWSYPISAAQHWKGIGSHTMTVSIN